jgi:hypothetical protein
MDDQRNYFELETKDLGSTHNCMQSIKSRSFDQILDGIDLRSEW